MLLGRCRAFRGQGDWFLLGVWGHLPRCTFPRGHPSFFAGASKSKELIIPSYTTWDCKSKIQFIEILSSQAEKREAQSWFNLPASPLEGKGEELWKLPLLCLFHNQEVLRKYLDQLSHCRHEKLRPEKEGMLPRLPAESGAALGLESRPCGLQWGKSWGRRRFAWEHWSGLATRTSWDLCAGSFCSHQLPPISCPCIQSLGPPS